MRVLFALILFSPALAIAEPFFPSAATAVPNVDNLIDTVRGPAIKIEGLDRVPVEVENQRMIDYEKGALQFGQIYDGGITAALGLSLLKIETSTSLDRFEKNESIGILLSKYNEYVHSRADTPEHAKIVSAADLYAGIVQSFMAQGLKLAVSEVAAFMIDGISFLQQKAEIDQGILLEQLRSGLPAHFRSAEKEKLQIGLNLTKLAQNLPDFDKLLQDNKFYQNARIDLKMSNQQFFNNPNFVAAYKNSANQKHKAFIDGKVMPNGTKQRPSEPAVKASEKELKTEMEKTFGEYLAEVKTATARLAKENDLSARRAIAEEITFHAKTASSTLYLASMLISDPGDKKALAGTGKLITSLASVTAEFSVNMIKYNVVLATGQFYVGIALAVLDFVGSLTGPSSDELILGAIRGVREHLVEVENRIRGHLLQIDGRIQRMSEQMHSMFRVLLSEMVTLRMQIENVVGHLKYIERLIQLSEARYFNVEWEKRNKEKNEKLKDCFSAEGGVFAECLSSINDIALQSADSLASGQPWPIGDWKSLPDIRPPFFHQLGTLKSVAESFGDKSLAVGVSLLSPTGEIIYQPVNPIEWADASQKFILYVARNFNRAIENPESFRKTYNTLVKLGENSAKSLSSLGERKGDQSNALQRVLSEYKQSISSLEQAVRTLRKNYEKMYLNDYSLNTEVDQIQPRPESIPNRSDNAKNRFEESAIRFCSDNEDEFLKSTVVFESARELKDSLSISSVGAKKFDWRPTVPMEFSSLLPREVRLHQDLKSQLNSFLRVRDQVLDGGLITERSLRVCIESVTWENRFSLAHLVNQQSAIDELFDNIIDDEDVWSKCTEEEKKLIHAAYARISSGKNHFGHDDGDDYLTLSVDDVNLIDNAMLTAAKYGYKKYSVDGRLEIENVFEFGYPSAVLKAYYSTDASKEGREQEIRKIRFTSPTPIQFATAQVDYRLGATPARWAEYEKRKGFGKLPPPAVRSSSTVPEITGPFPGRFYYAAHGNKRMNHFSDVKSPKYDGVNQLILGTHTDKYGPLDFPLLILALSQALHDSREHLDAYLKTNKKIVSEDFVREGYRPLVDNSGEVGRLGEIRKELKQFWTDQRIKFDQISLNGAKTDLVVGSLVGLEEVSRISNLSRSFFKLVRAYSYLAFPESIATSPELGRTLFGQGLQDPVFSDEGIERMLSAANARRWQTDIARNEDPSDSAFSSSIDPDRNEDLYCRTYAAIHSLESKIDDLVSRRTPVSKTDGSSLSAENIEKHALIESNLSSLKAMSIYLESNALKEDIHLIEAELSKFLRDKYGK